MGYAEISDDELIRYAKAAIEIGKPIDWDEVLERLPEGSLS
jgi:hypothetical protein